jgi:hypothetical protein
MPAYIFFFSALALAAQPVLTVNLAPKEALEKWVADFPLSNADRQAYVEKMFIDAKCPELIHVPLGKKEVPANIVCRWPGEMAKRKVCWVLRRW